MGYLALYEKITSHRSRQIQLTTFNTITREKQRVRIAFDCTKTKVFTNITNNYRANVPLRVALSSYAHTKQFLTHLVTVDVTVVPYNWPRDWETSSVRLYEVVSATHTHSLRYDTRPYTAVTGIFKMAHLHGANTFCSYFASHNKTYPEWHVSQNKFKIFKSNTCVLTLNVKSTQTSRFKT
jgi:hypothetical protein